MPRRMCTSSRRGSARFSSWRSRAISRKLRAVQTLDENTAATLLELDTDPGRPVTARLPESGEEL